MPAASSQETAMSRGSLRFRNTITYIDVRFPAAPTAAHDPRLAPARISFNVNNLKHLSDGAIFLDYSINIPFECPIAHLLRPSPETIRDMCFSLLAAMRDPSRDVIHFLLLVVSQSAHQAAVDAVRQGRDGFSLVAEINAFFPLPNLHSFEEVIDEVVVFNDGGGRRGASSLVNRMSTVEFGKDCGSAEGDCCSICLVEFEVGMRLKKTECSHVFHEDCLHAWLLRKASCPSCPMCRADIAAAN